MRTMPSANDPGGIDSGTNEPEAIEDFSGDQQPFEQPDPDVPELVPARMVNEFTYCPRLFFLEWVESRFADNADTVEGTWRHKRVDTPAGRAPLPQDDGDEELKVARSLMLSSARLGVVAKCDLVEGTGEGHAVPVDTKKGKAPDIPEGAWEPERVQLCVQGLLLREAGYTCDHGFLWFVGSRRRVRVDFDAALVARTEELLGELRRTAASDVAPPPLVDSPKCPRCSLVGLCLPDETNVLLARQDRPPRRLIPSDDAPHPLYVNEPGAYVGKDHGRIQVTKKGEKLASVPLLDVSQLCIRGNVQVSTQLLRELFAREIPVCWFTSGGWFSGMAHGLPGKHVELRRRQVITASQGGLDIARRAITSKIRNSRTLLMRNSKVRPQAAIDRLKAAADQALIAPSVATLLGVEGAAARTYFGAFESMIRDDLSGVGAPFAFDNRNRRPPLDPVNCLLSYLYGLLAKELTVTAFAVGLDPYLGFYHRPRFGRPALALDLAEEFRPLIAESVTINLINNGEVRPSDFIVRAGGVTLTNDGRKKVLAAYERRLDTQVTHPVFGYTVSYRRTLEVQVRMLAAHLMGEIPEYMGFTTR